MGLYLSEVPCLLAPWVGFLKVWGCTCDSAHRGSLGGLLQDVGMYARLCPLCYYLHVVYDSGSEPAFPQLWVVRDRA